jgi:hypothetical protein
MDIPFLKLISTAYVNDSELPLQEEVVFENLKSVYYDFRETYPELATEIHNKSRAYQQDLIYRILDKEYESDKIEEALFNNILIKFGAQKPLIAELQKNPKTKVIYSIFEKNYDNCNTKCNQLDGKKKRTPAQLTRDIHYNNLSYDQDRCLKLCYLDYFTNIYAEGVVAYERCMNNLNPSNKITIRSFDEVITRYPLTGVCDDIMIMMNDLYKELNEFMTAAFKEDPQQRSAWIAIINQKLNGFRSGKPLSIDYDKVVTKSINPNDYIRSS